MSLNEKQNSIQMINRRNTNEEVTYRDIGSIEKSNKGC